MDFFKCLASKKPQQPQRHRRYTVPVGLQDRVLYLLGVIDQRNSSRRQAQAELWRLLEARCPELKQGNWHIGQRGSEVYVEEVAQ